MLNRETRGRCAGDAREMRGRGAGDTRGNAWKTHGRCSGFVQKMHRRPTGGCVGDALERRWRAMLGSARRCEVLACAAVSVSFEGEECDAAKVNVGRSTKGHHHTTHFLSRAQLPASSLSSVPKLPSTPPVFPGPCLPATPLTSGPTLQHHVPRTMAPSILSVLTPDPQLQRSWKTNSGASNTEAQSGLWNRET